VIENRKTYRLPFKTKVILGSHERVITGNAINISSGGLFIMLLESFTRDARLQAVFQLHPEKDPVTIQCQVKRIVRSSTNIDEIPGVGVNFIDDSKDTLKLIEEFMKDNRKKLEMASAILSSGEPDLNSLQPLIEDLHLPNVNNDLSDLRFQIERILKSIELVDKSLE